MNMISLRKIFVVAIIPLFFAGCSEYDKILKSDNTELKYKKAFEYYEAEEYNKASTLFKYLVPIYRATEKAAKIEYHYAQSLYKQRDYILAGYHFGKFAENYGNSQYVEDAEFKNAYCYYMLSPRFSLDQKNTYKALDAFQMFMRKYPGSERIDEAKEIVSELNNKLAKKSYRNSKLYFELGDYKAAIIALKNSLEDFPQSEYREQTLFYILKSSFLLAENSIQSKQKQRYQSTLDEYYSFIDEYPNSDFVKEAKNIYEQSSDYLNNNKS